MLARSYDVDELIGRDRVIREVCDILLEMIGESGANQDGNMGVWHALAAEFSYHPVVLAFARYEIFEGCCRFVEADVNDRCEVECDAGGRRWPVTPH